MSEESKPTAYLTMNPVADIVAAWDAFENALDGSVAENAMTVQQAVQCGILEAAIARLRAQTAVGVVVVPVALDVETADQVADMAEARRIAWGRPVTVAAVCEEIVRKAVTAPDGLDATGEGA